ncbi:DUF6145 family protein [Laedolimicola sp.]|uniref:DUF6145 family protein n=1 Tax=Laedolimicola sp. TaxID=2981663 RepID=UPI003F7D948D
MEQENTVLCGANSYEEKYFFNEQFAALPAPIKDELKIMCVLFVNQVGGILLLEFAPDGTLVFRVSSHEDDFFFDEIGSSLQIKELRRDKEELLASLEMFYRVFFLNEETEHA